MSATATQRTLGHQVSVSRPSETMLSNLFSWAGHGIERMKRDAARRRLLHQLAGMRDHLLLDIGIAEDEIYRVRGRHDFIPRAWADRISPARAGRGA